MSETQEVKETEANQQPEQNSPTMCEDYLKQLAVIQNKKEEEEAKTEPEPC